jgi:hypothetical protein
MIRAFCAAIGGLLVWSSMAWGQRPSDADAAAMIEKSRSKALDYARSLPNFVCMEAIRRYAPFHSQSGYLWRQSDTLTVRLSYFQQKEEHKLVAIDDKPSSLKYEELVGVTGAGEFGGTLVTIFLPSSETSFRWQGWKNVHGHRVAVYAYTVDVAHSRFVLANGVVGHPNRAVVAFHGELDVDDSTGEVLHFTYVADDIPKDLDLRYASTTVDYDFADVGGRDYLLPARSETEMGGPGVAARTVTEFREYRKFTADSTIEFGLPK